VTHATVSTVLRKKKHNTLQTCVINMMIDTPHICKLILNKVSAIKLTLSEG